VNQVRSELGLKKLQVSPTPSIKLTAALPYADRNGWLYAENVTVPGYATPWLGVPLYFEVSPTPTSLVHAYFNTKAGKSYLANIRFTHQGPLQPAPGSPGTKLVVKGPYNGEVDIVNGNAVFAFMAAGASEVIISLPQNAGKGQFFGIELIPVDTSM
jgi:hypothetical protein